VRRSCGLLMLVLLVSCSGDDKPAPDQGVDLAIKDQGVGEGREAGTDGADLGKRDAQKPDLYPASAWKPQATSVSEPLHAVWGLSAQNVFAVGKAGAILHYDGKGWTKMLNPKTADLYAIWALSPQEVYAAGDGVVVYYDGTEWKEAYSSTYTFNFRGLWAAQGSKTLYGVGEMGGTIRYKSGTPTAYWSSVSTSSSYGAMYGIWGVSETEIYAVGEKGLILKCSGDCTKTASWSKQPSGVTSDLRAIWGVSSADLYGVGFDGTILHYNGSTWSVMDSKSTSYFYGLWGSSGKDVFAVGDPIFKKEESVLHYDGSAWSKLPPASSTLLNAVWGSSPTDVHAVGNGGLILHYDGTKP
jgi:hypothetical protein